MNLKPLYNILETNMGRQNWMTTDALWAQSPFQVMWAAILIQNASSNNGDAAAHALLAATDNDPAKIRACTPEKLAEIIKPAGLYRTKAKYIMAAAEWSGSHNDNVAEIEKLDRETLQAELLGVKGLGNETADDIMLYGFHKPLFIADTYARRHFTWAGVDVPKTYRAFQTLAEEDAGLTWDEYQELHALIDEFGKKVKNQEQWDASFMSGFKLTTEGDA